jgi:hypothetical protein
VTPSIEGVIVPHRERRRLFARSDGFAWRQTRLFGGVAMPVHDASVELSAYFLAARTVVNREDPVGLLALGCPDDEYDPEVQDLTKRAVTADQVNAVFLHWFGESGAMPPEMAARIADGINQARAQRAP